MKKILIPTIIVVILLGGWHYYSINENPEPVDAIENNDVTFGFSYVPPEGWQLWEGISANMDTFINSDMGLKIGERRQFINEWTPENSSVMVFTRSEVDIKTRDLQSLARYTDEKTRDPLVHDTVMMVITPDKPNFKATPTLDDEKILDYIQLVSVPARYDRSKVLETHDTVSVTFPFRSSGSIILRKDVAKDAVDQELADMFVEFVRNLPL